MGRKRTTVLAVALKTSLLLLLISQSRKTLPVFNPANIELAEASYREKGKEYVCQQTVKGPGDELLQTGSAVVDVVSETRVEYTQETREIASNPSSAMESDTIQNTQEDNKNTDKKEEVKNPDKPESPIIPDDEEIVETPDNEETVEPVPSSGFLMDEKGMIYDFVQAENYVVDEYLVLPSEGCSGIRYGAFQNCDVTIIELKIPLNITYIEPGAFVGLSSLEWLEVEAENENYNSLDGVIFDKAQTTLLASPGGRTGIYFVPESVRQIEDYAFSNAHIYKIDMRGCKEMSIGAKMFGDEMGEGITIRTPRESFELYEQLFAQYDVVLDGMPK